MKSARRLLEARAPLDRPGGRLPALRGHGSQVVSGVQGAAALQYGRTLWPILMTLKKSATQKLNANFRNHVKHWNLRKLGYAAAGDLGRSKQAAQNVIAGSSASLHAPGAKCSWHLHYTSDTHTHTHTHQQHNTCFKLFYFLYVSIVIRERCNEDSSLQSERSHSGKEQQGFANKGKDYIAVRYQSMYVAGTRNLTSSIRRTNAKDRIG
eukprot:729386-Pelagomonas_calceolata.AAC.1